MTVGLLIDYPPGKDVNIERIFVTNDLTEPVLREAVAKKAQFVVTYHPTPFRSFKRITRRDPTSRIVLTCIRNGIAVYAPHTASDSAKGGVNDWLIGGLGEGKVKAVKPKDEENDPVVGAGRIMMLNAPTDLDTMIARIKKHLNLPHVRVGVAFDPDRAYDEKKGTAVLTRYSSTPIRSVAVCAGSGASVLQGCDADLFVTGEMSHHEVLACNAAGVNVVLCDHSNTERGYLQEFKSILQQSIQQEEGGDEVTISVSVVDRDPLTVV